VFAFLVLHCPPTIGLVIEMMGSMSSKRLVAIASTIWTLCLVDLAAATTQIFSGPDMIPNSVPIACRNALSANISCPLLYSATFVSNVRPVSGAVLNALCTSDCASSLTSFSQAAQSACGSTPYEFFANFNTNSSYTAAQVVDPFLWAYNVTCLTDGKSWCYADIANGNVGDMSISKTAEGPVRLVNVSISGVSSSSQQEGRSAQKRGYTLDRETTANQAAEIFHNTKTTSETGSLDRIRSSRSSFASNVTRSGLASRSLKHSGNTAHTVQQTTDSFTSNSEVSTGSTQEASTISSADITSPGSALSATSTTAVLTIFHTGSAGSSDSVHTTSSNVTYKVPSKLTRSSSANTVSTLPNSTHSHSGSSVHSSAHTAKTNSTRLLQSSAVLNSTIRKPSVGSISASHANKTRAASTGRSKRLSTASASTTRAPISNLTNSFYTWHRFQEQTTIGVTTLGACSPCLFKWEAAMLDNPYGNFRIDSGQFSSQLSACGVPASSYPITFTSSTVSATQTSQPPASTCTGTPYTVESGDTCQSIASEYSIAYGRFITDNNLDVNCTGLTPGREVCLGPSCTTLTVQQNTTCNSILANETFYLTQLLSWNPTIWSNCGNLDSMVNQTICISPPGTSYWLAPSSNATYTTTVSYVVPSTSFGTLPPQTDSVTWTSFSYVNTTIPIPSTVTAPPQNATVNAIYATLTAYCPYNATDYGLGLNIYDTVGNCSDLLQPYCDPMFDQPAAPSTTFPSSCLPAYYIGTPTPTATTSPDDLGAPVLPGTDVNCTRFYVVQTEDSCDGIVADYSGEFSLNDFYTWNPSVGSTCGGLIAGYAVCVGIPGTPTTPQSSASSAAPTQTGIASNCQRFYAVKAGDSCQGIVNNYDGEFTLAQFYGWNPAVGSNCEHLNVGYDVCVGVPGTPTVAPTSSQATSTGPPTQSGIASNCDRFYTVQSGDSCQAIVDDYEGEFTLNQFYSWNPAVGSSCQYLIVGDSVCVGVPGTPTVPPTSTSPTSTSAPTQSGIASNCNRFYTVQSGDSCQAIVNDYEGEFTLSQFYSWNPAVGSGCQYLVVGDAVCVGVPGSSTVPPTTTAPTAAPTQSGIASNCDRFYTVQSGDSCQAIVDDYDGEFTLAQFYSWNPAVGSNCQYLDVGYAVCVGVPGTPTTPPTSTTTSATPTGPSPQEPSTDPNCKTYHQVGTDDSCYNIEQEYGITAAQFNDWNPNVGSDCAHLWSGYYVCVGV